MPEHPFPWHLSWRIGDDENPDIMDANGQTVADPDAGCWFSLHDLEALCALTEAAATPEPPIT